MGVQWNGQSSSTFFSSNDVKQGERFISDFVFVFRVRTRVRDRCKCKTLR